MYTPDGSIIDVTYDEAVYDSFIYDNEKIVVLKNEQFDEFIDPSGFLNKNEKLFLLGKVFSQNGTDYIFPLGEEKYFSALAYYLALRNSYSEVAKDGE